MDQKVEKEKPWKGVEWIRSSGGICPKHGTAVGDLTKLCILCHREQLAAASAGSREWEMK